MRTMFQGCEQEVAISGPLSGSLLFTSPVFLLLTLQGA